MNKERAQLVITCGQEHAAKVLEFFRNADLLRSLIYKDPDEQVVAAVEEEMEFNFVSITCSKCNKSIPEELIQPEMKVCPLCGEP